jgi:hypothetical protein
MPKDFSDLGQRCAVVEHLGCQSVPELVRTFSTTVDPSARQRLPDD